MSIIKCSGEHVISVGELIPSEPIQKISDIHTHPKKILDNTRLFRLDSQMIKLLISRRQVIRINTVLLKMTNPTIQIGEKHRGLKNPNELGDDLDYSIWVDCEFTNCELSGAEICSSIFSRCIFEDVSLYWSSGILSTFIDTKFIRCDLRGWFDNARFVRCTFVECEHGKDGLGGSTKWENAIAIGCHVRGEALPIINQVAEQDMMRR